MESLVINQHSNEDVTTTTTGNNNTNVHTCNHDKGPAEEEEEEKGSDRIYIGGMDVYKLSIEEVITRVQSLHDSYNKSDYDNSTNDEFRIDVPRGGSNGGYFFVSASKEEGKELIKKYHNVKWRGCKLKVEYAKKSFLERLEEEREEKRVIQEQKRRAEEAEEKLLNAKSVECKHATIPRNLKIRHKYGIEKMKVDTKPLEVRTSCCRKDIRSKPLYRDISRKRTRAIHVIFDSESEAESVTVDDSEIGEESISSRSNNEKCFVWSDDDNKAEDVRDKIRKEDTGEQEQENVSLRDHLSISDESSASSEAHSTTAEPQFIWSDDEAIKSNVQNKLIDNFDSKTGKYVWSDDEDDDGKSMSTKSSSEGGKIPNSMKSTKIECCEFTSAIEDVQDINQNDDDSSTLFFLGEDREFADIELENTQSMKVLTSMFPDLKPRKEKKIEPFGATIIPRFDPTAEVQLQLPEISKSNEIENSNEDRSVSSESSNQDSSSSETHGSSIPGFHSGSIKTISKDIEDEELENMVRLTEKEHNENQKDIYRQNDLEDIFHNAKRSNAVVGVSDDVLVEDTADKQVVSSSGGFSFGFSLEQTTNSPDESETSDMQSVGNVSIEASASSQNLANQEKTEYPKRFRGLFKAISSSMLNELHESFFNLNKIEDIEDEEHAEKWNNQRKFLTTDWKQKRKRALKKAASSHTKKTSWKKHRNAS